MIVFKNLYFVVSLIFIFLASGCRLHNNDESPVGEGDPIVYVKRKIGAIGNPIDSITFNSGGDLYWRYLSTPSAKEVNVTGHLTLGKGDVSDPEPSFDGKKIIFAMRCTHESSEACYQDETWNIWMYDHPSDDIYRVIRDPDIAKLGDDVDPVFLPGGRIVFSSTRQKKTRSKLGYAYLDEDGRSAVTTLHVMNEDGTGIEQISFNQSHDRNPSILRNGKILYSRWDHAGHQNKFSLYTINPDGTELTMLYGGHSPGDSFLHAREVAEGRIISTVIPLQGTWEGGALMDINVKDFSDNDDPVPGFHVEGAVGQVSATLNNIPLGREKSPEGRFSTPYALAGGSGQVLTSYSPFKPVTRQDPITKETIIVPEREGAPVYAIYLLDINTKSLKPIVLPEDDVAITDPVALEPRNKPPIIRRQIMDDSLIANLAKEEGILNIKSVYDTDQYGRMSNGVLTRVEQAAMAIPMIEPADPTFDTRNLVADIAKIKDPAVTSADQRPARFIRVSAAVPTPPGLSRRVIGETVYEMQRVIGYAPIEPDGSVRVKVPADVSLAVSVLDKAGRAYQNHTSWLQVRPGEERVCNGCHSPARGRALNVTPIAGHHPNTQLKKVIDGQVVNVVQDGPDNAFDLLGQAGETMAETRVRLDASTLELSQDLIFYDVWSDESVGQAAEPFKIEYASIRTDAIPENGIINYPEHIQPLWDARKLTTETGDGAKQCIECHDGISGSDNPSGLNLRGGTNGESGRIISYSELVIGKPFYDEEGVPILDTVDGIPFLRRRIPYVEAGHARGSYLIEKLFNEELHAEEGLLGNGLDHSQFLLAAEKKLVIEWIDLGAQYHNSPYDECGKAVSVVFFLDRTAMFTEVAKVLSEPCSRCHRPFKKDGTPNPQFKRNSFILTGDREGDFHAAASMVTDIEVPENSYLVDRPSSLTSEHPMDSRGRPWLQIGSSEYNVFIKWIQSARERQVSDDTQNCSQ